MLDDLIRRSDVIDILEMYPFTEYGDYEEAREVINRLPSAQIERKKGKWIHKGLEASCVRCSVCGYRDYAEYYSNYCPHCGADMRKGKE